MDEKKISKSQVFDQNFIGFKKIKLEIIIQSQFRKQKKSQLNLIGKYSIKYVMKVQRFCKENLVKLPKMLVENLFFGKTDDESVQTCNRQDVGRA